MQLMEAVSGMRSMLMLKCPQWRESSLSLLSLLLHLLSLLLSPLPLLLSPLPLLLALLAPLSEDTCSLLE